MKKYPDVYIPFSLRNVVNAKPERPPLPPEPTKPEQPLKETWLKPIIVGLVTLGISFEKMFNS